MSDRFRFEIVITEDLSMAQEMEIIRAIAKAGQVLGALGLLKGRHSINTQPMQALLNAAAMNEAAAAGWGGNSSIQIPTMVPPHAVPRPS
jgi:hypothetical protein